MRSNISDAAKEQIIKPYILMNDDLKGCLEECGCLCVNSTEFTYCPDWENVAANFEARIGSAPAEAASNDSRASRKEPVPFRDQVLTPSSDECIACQEWEQFKLAPQKGKNRKPFTPQHRHKASCLKKPARSSGRLSHQPLFENELFKEADYRTIASAMGGTLKFNVLEQQAALGKFSAKKARKG